jgi:site-specific recombinase XerD
LSALLFIYGKVLNVRIPWLNEIGRPNAPKRLPTVLTREEVNSIFLQIDSLEQHTFAKLLYGTGVRISESMQLRIKDIEFSQNAVIVREGKGLVRSRSIRKAVSLGDAAHPTPFIRNAPIAGRGVKSPLDLPSSPF